MALKIESPAPPPIERPLELNKPAGQEAPAPAPTPAEKKKPDVNLDGLKNFIKDFDRYGDAETPPPPEKKTKEEKPAKAEPETKKPVEKPVLPSKAKTPGTKPFKPKHVPALTPEQIAAAAAEGTARALTAQKPKAEAGPETKAKDEPKLSPQDQRKVEILNRMHELYPDKYEKDIGEKYASSLAKLEAYAKEWETAHPGQDFDEESPEHEDFFKNNDVNWEDDDYTEALADIRAQRRAEESGKKTQDRLDALDRQEKLRQRAADIAAEQNTAALSFWKEFGEGFDDLVKPDGSLNMERVNALKASDPEGLAIRIKFAQNLDQEVAEVYKLYEGLVENDPEHNPVHRELNQFIVAKEKELSSKPTQERMNAEGKLFLPAAQFARLTKAERENHWMLSKQDVAFLLATDRATIARKQVEVSEEHHKTWARARGLPVDEPADAKPESPSSGGESRMAAVATAGGASPGSNGKILVRDVT